MMTSVRLDKWLWAARFFKTRSLASRACELGRVLWNGNAAKPAREVKVGDVLQVTTAGGVFGIEVTGLGEVRGSAAVAATLFVESEGSREARLKVAAERKALGAFVAAPATRPSKRDRREILRFRGRE